MLISTQLPPRNKSEYELKVIKYLSLMTFVPLDLTRCEENCDLCPSSSKTQADKVVCLGVVLMLFYILYKAQADNRIL